MRRITILCAWLLCGMGASVSAQTTVTSLDDLRSDVAYELHNPNGYGYAVYNADRSTTSLWLAGATVLNSSGEVWGDASYQNDFDGTALGSRFQIISQSGKYFLYSLGAGKFVGTQQGAVYFSDTPIPISVEAVTGGFAFNSTTNAYYYMCAATHLNPPLMWWTKDDKGSVWEIIEPTDQLTETPDLDAAVSVVEEFMSSALRSLDDVDDGAAYWLHNVNEYGYAIYDADKSTTMLWLAGATVTNNNTWGDESYKADFDGGAQGSLFQIIKRDDLYYLYNVGAGKFVKTGGETETDLVEAPTPINISSVGGSFVFNTGTEYLKYMCSSPQFGTPVRQWTSSDPGSQWEILYPTDVDLTDVDLTVGPGKVDAALAAAALADKVAALQETAGYVGGYTAEQLADIGDYETLADLEEYLATLAPIAIESGKYYRIENVLKSLTEARTRYMITATADGRVCTEANRSDASLVWQIFPDESVENGYKFRNANFGAYMNTIAGGNALVEETEAATFTLYDLGNAQFNLQNGGTNLVRFSTQASSTAERAGTAMGGWYDSPAGSDGAWYIVPATELEVTLNTVDSQDYWATLHLPFDVTLPEGLTANVGRADDARQEFTLTEITDVPANTGVILKGGQADYVLNIAEATATVPDNDLRGTNVAKDRTEGAATYVLSSRDDEVGLFILNEGTTTLAANKAYLEYEAGTTSSVQGYRFGFGGTTGVAGVETAAPAGEAVYHDLSGRRVTAPARGIYILNGRKVVVK